MVIDLIPDGTERRAVVCGGPANTAKALSKLGIATQFIDGISTDKYGQMALKELNKDGVLLDFVKFSDSQRAVPPNEGAARWALKTVAK